MQATDAWVRRNANIYPVAMACRLFMLQKSCNVVRVEPQRLKMENKERDGVACREGDDLYSDAEVAREGRNIAGTYVDSI